jgi:hypothetical protein
VATAPFPPDDRSLGWERATTISKDWDQATTDAALDTAAYVSAPARLNELAGTGEGAADRDAKVRSFCLRFTERAFRRPLTDEQKKLFIDRQFEAVKEPEMAVKRVVLLALKSPRFLYREVAGGPDHYDVACRLAFALWDAPPDAELLKAAAEGKLAAPRPGGQAGGTHAGRPTRPCQAPRVPADLVEGRSGAGRRQGLEALSGLRPGRRHRPAHLARTVPG